MTVKLVGAMLIVAGCGGFGMLIAANYRREERALRQLLGCLDYMECELQYRLTPLPELCRQAAKESAGPVRAVFAALAEELEDQISPDAERCASAALARVKDLPSSARRCLSQLGASLGRFDLPGQLKGLEGVRAACRAELERLGKNRDVRLRSYETLSLCAGAALAMLLL